jgi:tRNA(fMet)-specific endonuclease VapC
MNGKLLLDTSVVIALFRGDAGVKERLKDIGETFVAAVALGELYYGAYKSGLPRHNLDRVDEFARTRLVLGCDDETADWYGRIKNALRAKGKPLPDNDMWIAAVALQHELILVTRDVHFSEVEGLSVERW